LTSISDANRELPIAHRQMIEIAKALMRHTRVLVMDEPTSSLTNVEIERLFPSSGNCESKALPNSLYPHKLGKYEPLVTVLLY